MDEMTKYSSLKPLTIDPRIFKQTWYDVGSGLQASTAEDVTQTETKFPEVLRSAG